MPRRMEVKVFKKTDGLQSVEILIKFLRLIFVKIHSFQVAFL